MILVCHSIVGQSFDHLIEQNNIQNDIHVLFERIASNDN